MSDFWLDFFLQTTPKLKSHFDFLSIYPLSFSLSVCFVNNAEELKKNSGGTDALSDFLKKKKLKKCSKTCNVLGKNISLPNLNHKSCTKIVIFSVLTKVLLPKY